MTIKIAKLTPGWILALPLLFLTVTAVSCDQKAELRYYDEITLESPLERQEQQAMTDPHPFITQMAKKTGNTGLASSPDSAPTVPGAASTPPAGSSPLSAVSGNMMGSENQFEKIELPLTWETPETWTEQQGSGMRLATFISKDPNVVVESSIVILGGAAGGLESNVVRWMGQINVPVPEASRLKEFLAGQERFVSKGGFEGVLIDLTELQSQGDPAALSMIAAILQVDQSTVFIKMMGSQDAVRQNRDALKNLSKSIANNE